jgi:hypothetical protein
MQYWGMLDVQFIAKALYALIEDYLYSSLNALAIPAARYYKSVPATQIVR